MWSRRADRTIRTCTSSLSTRYLVVEYKNWAALDNLGGKLDAVSASVEGSLDKAQQSQIERAKIRTILGSQTMQAAELK